MDSISKSIVQTVRQPLLILDENQRIVMMNAPFRNTFHVTEERVVGAPLSALGAKPWDTPGLSTLLEDVIPENDFIEDYEMRFTQPDGEDRILFLNARRIHHDVDGNPLILLSFEDVTERTNARRQLEELNTTLETRVRERTHDLEAAVQELEAFCYSVSHDLRAPLRVIDGFSDELLRSFSDSLDDRGRHYIDRIRQAARRMGNLIDDLLRLSRLSRTEMLPRRVDLTTLAHNILTELRRLEPERNLQVVIEPELTVQGDETLFRSVLENLISNAWKFTSKTASSRIHIGAETRGGGRTFFVRDNGVGFDMAHSSKLFGAFQRLHRETEFPGNGIGLAIVKRIIRRHGGRIWAESEPGKGAVFYFTVPGEDAS